MSQQELLKRVIQALEYAGIEYMVTGSTASSLQGEPRSPHDIDLVVAIEKSAFKKLLDAFPPPDFYLDEDSILDALSQQGMFNLIDVNEGEKVDFWILTDDAFDQSRFARKCVEEVMGFRMCVSSPEDTILAKLRWAKLSGGSEKQFTDALRVYVRDWIWTTSIIGRKRSKSNQCGKGFRRKQRSYRRWTLHNMVKQTQRRQPRAGVIPRRGEVP